jgi:hypothetical protein
MNNKFKTDYFFTPPSPYGEGQGGEVERYSYAWNNPLRYTDPTGMIEDGDTIAFSVEHPNEVVVLGTYTPHYTPLAYVSVNALSSIPPSLLRYYPTSINTGNLNYSYNLTTGLPAGVTAGGTYGASMQRLNLSMAIDIAYYVPDAMGALSALSYSLADMRYLEFPDGSGMFRTKTTGRLWKFNAAGKILGSRGNPNFLINSMNSARQSTSLLRITGNMAKNVGTFLGAGMLLYDLKSTVNGEESVSRLGWHATGFGLSEAVSFSVSKTLGLGSGAAAGFYIGFGFTLYEFIWDKMIQPVWEQIQLLEYNINKRPQDYYFNGFQF